MGFAVLASGPGPRSGDVLLFRPMVWGATLESTWEVVRMLSNGGSVSTLVARPRAAASKVFAAGVLGLGRGAERAASGGSAPTPC